MCLKSLVVPDWLRVRWWFVFAVASDLLTRSVSFDIKTRTRSLRCRRRGNSKTRGKFLKAEAVGVWLYGLSYGWLWWVVSRLVRRLVSAIQDKVGVSLRAYGECGCKLIYSKGTRNDEINVVAE